MQSLFQQWQEFRAWRKCRAIVNFQTREDQDRKAMAELVGTPGYKCLKALMIDAALTETMRFGSKSEKAPGLAVAVGVIAQCEAAVEQMTQKLKETKGGE